MSKHRDPPADEPIYTINNPPPPRPSAEAMAEVEWRRMQASPDFSDRLFGHCRPGILARAPIRLYGIAQRFPGATTWLLYRDAAGSRRVYRADDHDQAGIAALFIGAEGWLCRLWPDGDGGWDDNRASETLIFSQGCIGTIDAAALGFELPREPA